MRKQLKPGAEVAFDVHIGLGRKVRSTGIVMEGSQENGTPVQLENYVFERTPRGQIPGAVLSPGDLIELPANEKIEVVKPEPEACLLIETVMGNISVIRRIDGKREPIKILIKEGDSSTLISADHAGDKENGNESSRS